MKNLINLLLLLCFTLSAQVASAQCSITGPSSLFTGNSANYSTPAAIGSSYFWSVTGPLSITSGNTGTSVNVMGNAPGTGQVCVTRFQAGQAPCCNCKTVTVTNEPTCIPATNMFVGQIEIPGQGCPGDNIPFVATLFPSNADFTNSSFLWQAGQGFIGSNIFFSAIGGKNMTIPMPISATSVWVRVKFTSPCDGSMITRFTIVTWERDCLFIRSDEMTEEKASSKSSILSPAVVAPNPFSNSTELSFNSTGEMEAQLNVFNVTGQSIYSQKVLLVEGLNTIELNQLPAQEKGVLYYQLTTEKEVLGLGKMLRQD